MATASSFARSSEGTADLENGIVTINVNDTGTGVFFEGGERTIFLKRKLCSRISEQAGELKCCTSDALGGETHTIVITNTN
jgi:hypothetical protein